MTDLQGIRVDRVALHEVFVRPANGAMTAPRLSSELTTLESRGLRALETQLIKSLGKQSHCMEMHVAEDSADTAIRFCSEMLRGTDVEFLESSRKLAHKLNRAQTSQNIPGGVVVVIGGKIGSYPRPFVAIIKAEVHEGFARSEGDESILLMHLDNLLLTPQQKLFKIGIFIEKEPPSDPTATRYGDEFEALVYDHLMKVEKPAAYFYDSFLGCQVAHTPRRETRRFYELTKRFIREMPVNDERKIELTTALGSYLRGAARQTLHVADFGEGDFLPQERELYREFMAEQGFSENVIELDITDIRSNLKVKRIKFSNDIRLTGPAVSFNRHVTVTTEDGFTTVRIEGGLIDQT